jgi:hypothetical protein
MLANRESTVPRLACAELRSGVPAAWSFNPQALKGTFADPDGQMEMLRPGNI